MLNSQPHHISSVACPAACSEPATPREAARRTAKQKAGLRVLFDALGRLLSRPSPAPVASADAAPAYDHNLDSRYIRYTDGSEQCDDNAVRRIAVGVMFSPHDRAFIAAPAPANGDAGGGDEPRRVVHVLRARAIADLRDVRRHVALFRNRGDRRD